LRKNSSRAASQPNTSSVSVHVPKPQDDQRVPSDDAANTVLRSAVVPKKKRGWAGKIAMPTGVSHPPIPIGEGSFRRCSRLNKSDGFCPVRLEKKPRKKSTKLVLCKSMRTLAR
jgi:hypothetical protein